MAVCETTYTQEKVVVDVPKCTSQPQEVCVGEPVVCKTFQRQACDLVKEEQEVTIPDTKCSRVNREVCGPESCPLVQGEDVCRDETAMVNNKIHSVIF